LKYSTAVEYLDAVKGSVELTTRKNNDDFYPYDVFKQYEYPKPEQPVKNETVQPTDHDDGIINEEEENKDYDKINNFSV
jgi:hypothetical protein